MSLHYLSLGNSLGSTKLVETLIKASKPKYYLNNKKSFE